MRFAWSRADEAAGTQTLEAPATVARPYELAAIELLTETGGRVGWIATQGQRTSDWLNERAQVPVHGLSDRASNGSAEPDVAANRPDAPATDLSRDLIVWVVPPPLPPNRHLRLHRRRVLVHLELDDHEISGQVHVRPGADASDQVLRGTREMIPLTDVQVMSRHDPGDRAALAVLIVNRAHVRRIIVDAAHPSAPVPEPEGQAPTSESAPTPEATPEPAPTPAAAEAPIETGAELVQSALLVLLETGVIDVLEFQSIRARIPTAPHA